MAVSQYMPPRDIPALFEALFEVARRRDEFDYCQALLRGRTAGAILQEPLSESRRLMDQMVSMLEAPVNDSFKLRLLLLVYCQTTDNRDVYEVTANMLRIVAGLGYIPQPFAAEAHKSGITATTSVQRAERVAELAELVGLEDLGDLFIEMLVPDLLNHFRAGTYFMDESKFYVDPGRPESGGKVIDLEWALPRLNRGILTTLNFVDTTQRHIRAYQKSKVLAGIDAQARTQGKYELAIEPGIGLTGFTPVAEPKAPPATEVQP